MTDSDSDALELASAYLDGEVTAAERARVESDPELRAEVERLRQVRRAVAEIPAAPSESREAAITAALSAFDELQLDAPAPPNVVALAERRKARWMQGLGAAAAAVVVIVGGFAVANRGTGDDDSADQLRPAQVVTVTTADQGASESPVTTAAATPARATVGATQPGDTASEFDSAADQPMIAASIETAEAEPSLDAAGAPAAAAVAPPVVHDASELRSVAVALASEPPPLDDVVDDCELGTGVLDPDALFDDGEEVLVEVIVASTPDGFAAVAIDTCKVVLRVAT